MPLRQWMTADPITAGPSETVREALQRMRRHGVDELPVTLGGEVLGMIRGSDVLARALAPAASVNAGELGLRPVADFLSDAVAVPPETPGEEALGRMRASGASVLCVVEAGRLVGTVAAGDLLGFLLERMDRRAARRPSLRTGNQLDVLLRVAREATESLELATILQEITRHAMAALPIDQSALLLLPDRDAPFLVVHSLYSAMEEEQRLVDLLPVEGTLSGWVTLQRRSLKVDDLDREGRYRHPSERFGGRMRSLVCTPLLFQNECLGVLNFWCRRPHAYLDSDLELMELIAGHISAAIQSARRVAREQKLVEELREVNRIQDEFLAVATHDMRNALQGVLAYIGILSARARRDSTLVDLSENLFSAASSMKTLISDLHDLARLGMRAIRLHPSRVDLADLVRSVLDQQAEFAREEEVELTSLPPDPPLSLEADPVRLRQILYNLVSNAIKYNRPGGLVVVGWRQEDEEAIVEVRDTGLGVRPEHQEAIFDLFRRVTSSSHKVEGSGLGLTITRQLVDLHKGRIELESELGVGSTFRVRLPLHRIPDEERPLVEPLPPLAHPGAHD